MSKIKRYTTNARVLVAEPDILEFEKGGLCLWDDVKQFIPRSLGGEGQEPITPESLLQDIKNRYSSGAVKRAEYRGDIQV